MTQFSQHVVALARTIRSTGDFALLPILADALEECDIHDAEWLRHCREPWTCPRCKGDGALAVRGRASAYQLSAICTDCRGVGTTPRTSSWVVSAILASVGDSGEHPLRGVCEEPGSDAPRLAYADRAELVQVQLEIAKPVKYDWTPSQDDVMRWGVENIKMLFDLNNWRPAKRMEDLRLREHELLVANASRWFAGIDATIVAGQREIVRGSTPGITIYVRRGFPAEITCTWQDWRQHHAEWWWSPLQTVECPQCEGDERMFRYTPDKHCRTCRGSGRVPRPFPTGERECGRCVPDSELRVTMPDWNAPMRSLRLADMPVPRSHCRTCRGTGRVPGEPSVMPLEVVRLTTLPDSDWLHATIRANGVRIDNGCGYEAMYRKVCASVWPGLRIEFADGLIERWEREATLGQFNRQS